MLTVHDRQRRIVDIITCPMKRSGMCAIGDNGRDNRFRLMVTFDCAIIAFAGASDRLIQTGVK